jgi:hypothetical protein
MKKFLLLVSTLFFVSFSFSQPKHPYYGGGHHTKGHGGHYAGGRGSHHRGGHYVNHKTQNTYGRHKYR